jgi:hypothetical protein
MAKIALKRLEKVLKDALPWSAKKIFVTVTNAL